MKTNPIPLIFPLIFFFAFSIAHISWSQEDILFHAVRVKGNIMAYHDENDETARLYTNQTVDDGDRVTAAADSEVVLRLDQKVYVYLAPHTRIHIIRLRQGDKGMECKINLVTGRMLCQLEQNLDPPFTVSAGGVYCHEHGSLFEVIRKQDDLTVVSFQGAVVADFHGTTKMAKTEEVLTLSHGKFRNKTHHLSAEEKAHLKAWEDLISEIVP